MSTPVRASRPEGTTAFHPRLAGPVADANPDAYRPGFRIVCLAWLSHDLDAAEAAVLGLGATKHEHQPGATFRVFLDPAGHPFCLCLD